MIMMHHYYESVYSLEINYNEKIYPVHKQLELTSIFLVHVHYQTDTLCLPRKILWLKKNLRISTKSVWKNPNKFIIEGIIISEVILFNAFWKWTLYISFFFAFLVLTNQNLTFKNFFLMSHFYIDTYK